jgi:hypothetical protein
MSQTPYPLAHHRIPEDELSFIKLIENIAKLKCSATAVSSKNWAVEESKGRFISWLV